MLLKLMHLDLQAHPPSDSVTGILLTAETGDPSKVQLGLFSQCLQKQAAWTSHWRAHRGAS